MLRYTLKRLLQLAVALLGLTLLLFAWFKALPGGPENRMLPDNATPEQREALRQALGLDEPIWTQYGEFLSRIVHLDFGKSSADGEVDAGVGNHYVEVGDAHGCKARHRLSTSASSTYR